MGANLKGFATFPFSATSDYESMDRDAASVTLVLHDKKLSYQSLIDLQQEWEVNVGCTKLPRFGACLLLQHNITHPNWCTPPFAKPETWAYPLFSLLTSMFFWVYPKSLSNSSISHHPNCHCSGPAHHPLLSGPTAVSVSNLMWSTNFFSILKPKWSDYKIQIQSHHSCFKCFKIPISFRIKSILVNKACRIPYDLAPIYLQSLSLSSLPLSHFKWAGLSSMS